MPLDLTDDTSTLVHVMDWCRQATSHYLGQCWPRSPTPHGVTRPQLVKYQPVSHPRWLWVSPTDRVCAIWSWTFNYVNPVCCVATVCHQVRCMYWGHLGHFHRAISHLKWYKIVCVRCLACTFSQMESINMFARFLQSGVPRHFLWRFIEPHCFHVYVCQCRPQTLAAICRNMGIWDVFMLRPQGKIYLGFASLPSIHSVVCNYSLVTTVIKVRAWMSNYTTT